MNESIENQLSKSVGEKNGNPIAEIGWTQVPVNECPSKGIFYPKGTIIEIKSPRTNEIKHYSTMDSESILDVERHVDEIMAKNCRITFGDDLRVGNSKDLVYFDKLHFLFLIREKAMLNYNSKRKLTQNVKNPKNPSEIKNVEIDQNTFKYFDIDKGLMKWYDQQNLCFHIIDETEEPKIDIKLYVPSVGVIKWIKNYITEKEMAKRRGEESYYNDFFLKVLQYITPDHQLLEKEGFFEEKLEWFNNLNLDENDILIDAISKLSVGIKPNITVIFDDEEVSVPIRFQDYKSIFSVSNRTKLLLSDS